MLVDYYRFITRDVSPNGTMGFDAIPNFYYKTILWSLFFCALHLIIPFLVKNMHSSWYRNLNSKDRRELSSYLVCMIHHVAMVPPAWIHIYQDWLIPDEAAALLDYGLIEAAVGPFSIGYLIGDTLCFALPEALGLRFEYLVHHLFTVYLIVSSVFGPCQLCRFIPHLIICDTTNIFFNLAWLLRRSGWKGSTTVICLEVIFGWMFLVTRVINLPMVFFTVAMSDYGPAMGLSRFTFGPISLMQWFWFWKIIATMVKRVQQSGSIAGKKSDTSSGVNKSGAKRA